MALRHVVSSLTLEQAVAIATGTIAAGRRERMLPLAVVVVDAGRPVVTVQRDDGCGTLRIRIAQGKARGALGMGNSLAGHPRSAGESTRVPERSGHRVERQFIPVPGAACSSSIARGAPSGRWE